MTINIQREALTVPKKMVKSVAVDMIPTLLILMAYQHGYQQENEEVNAIVDAFKER